MFCFPQIVQKVRNSNYGAAFANFRTFNSIPRIEHCGLGVKRDALFKELYIIFLQNMNYVFDISMEIQLTNLSIDIFVFEMTKLRTV